MFHHSPAGKMRLSVPPYLQCHIFSHAGMAVAFKLASGLKTNPWLNPEGIEVSICHLYAPTRLCLKAMTANSISHILCACDDMGGEIRQSFTQAAGHIFIGAAGVAVRLLAPCLQHKSQDPPVVVVDAAARHAISLLSGHWGGGNSLAIHVAGILQACPVITTASDSMSNQDCSLDLLIRKAGMKILDWNRLPVAQAKILEGECLSLYDPMGYLPPAPWLCPLTKAYKKNGILRVAREKGHPGENHPKLSYDPERTGDIPEKHPPFTVLAHWRKLAPSGNVLRIIPPFLHVGMGFRADVAHHELLAGLREIFDRLDLQMEAVAALATVKEKAGVLSGTAAMLGVPLHAWDAIQLAEVSTPNPSDACGRRFNCQPFSVCESAALLSATMHSGMTAKDPGYVARLLYAKIRLHGKMTFAIAASMPPGIDPESPFTV